MNKICDLIGVKLVDHIIVGPGNEFYSFQEKNQMPLASLKGSIFKTAGWKNSEGKGSE